MQDLSIKASSGDRGSHQSLQLALGFQNIKKIVERSEPKIEWAVADILIWNCQSRGHGSGHATPASQLEFFPTIWCVARERKALEGMMPT